MSLIRISLIVAILAALGAGVMGYLEVSKQIPALVQQRDDENKAKHTALTELDTTKKTLAKTKTELAQTQQDLADAQAQREKAVATAAAQTKRANGLADKLSQATQDRDDAQNKLASYTSSGLTALQVADLDKSLKKSAATIEAMNEEKVVFQRTITRLTNELAKFVEPNSDIKLPPDMRGKIVVVDPKWEFVIVNVGVEQGMINGGELLVSRDGKLVAKVVVRSVDKDRCIANLVPGWNFGPIVEGDVISPAHPAPAS